MSIIIKKYTKEQMAKMVEEAQSAQKEAEDAATTYFEGAKKLSEHISKMETKERDLRAKNAILTEQLDQMNGEAINKANEIANLKADADVLRNKLADTEAALGRANDEITFKSAALNVMHKLNVTRDRRYNAEQRADYAEAHPFETLWEWMKRKLGWKA